jgi:hypothetical protein
VGLRADFTKFARRPAAERRRLLQALMVVSCATMALRVVSTVRLPRLLRPVVRMTARGGPRTPVEILAWSVVVTSRYVPGASCLPRALALRALLEHAGQPARVCVGLNRCADGELGGHAWVEGADGRPIAGQEPEAYSPLLVLDADGPRPA